MSYISRDFTPHIIDQSKFSISSLNEKSDEERGENVVGELTDTGCCIGVTATNHTIDDR